MKFCSNCGSNQLDFVIPKNDSFKRFFCGNCGIIHYQNPNLIVGGLVLYENKILLCKRAIDPKFGLWNLPAGFLENGETVEAGALREIYEESLVKPKIIKPHVIYNLPGVDQVYIHFLCEMDKPKFGITPESSEVKLFSPDDIPWDDIAFHSTRFAIEKYLEHGPEFQGVHVGTYQGNEKWR